jgi:folate-binding protein YgfZ
MSEDVATPISALAPRPGALAVRSHQAVSVSGDDATSFLQGQCSQDIALLGENSSAWTFVLEPDGKLGFLVFAVRVGDGYRLLCAEKEVDGLLARLRRFALRVAVIFATTEVTLLFGPERPQELEDAVDLIGLQCGPSLNAWMIDSEHASAGFDVDTVFDPWFTSAWFSHLDFNDACEGMNPFSFGASFIAGSCSFTKGCYTGQELVARVEARGAQAPLQLCAFSASGPVETGLELLRDGVSIGSVERTAIDAASGSTRGFCLVKRSALSPDGFTALAGQTEVSVRMLDAH